ncbi:hypothetical protein S7711_08312 [Stachybotrys chartarum IBT 7711]|uniref:Uncharacterized protein n=1 Tax=Stachybotrys chartarum (strain CBS 109288 / IBT 7711) TaxID=1280523 RepID=A0A084AJJ3_STACB|nr:hypothetical protein S7711_08312 [Stachybotrys chartarum IBT 7711]KFA45631.1 hypothetical protein S40293_09117 [Stachybotrys chartarum IBT 40293]
MDARPLRPRGAENIVPNLHQRHKSTGNLTAMMPASTAGFRGPAKRAAFGDVTNVVKNVGNGYDEAKGVKAQLGMSYQAELPALANKENPLPGKDVLSRPAQRVPALANKHKGTTEARANDENRKPGRITIHDSIRLISELDGKNPQARTSHDAQSLQASNVSQPAAPAPAPLQPRHHKSQPQLKQQQPTLRKTQSKHLDAITIAHSRMPLPDVPADIKETTAHMLDQHVIEVDYVDSVYLPTELQHEVEAVELPQKMHGIPDAGVPPVTYKDAIAPAMSEPEEYWDEEDEEDYDDQDQAYTTAHSFRSRDLTTSGATTLLAPRITARVQRELEEARLEVMKNTTPEEIDEESWDVSMVAEYGEEIFDYMRDLEIKMLPNPHYMDNQTEIQWSMRSVLMDWLVQVHGRFGLLPETLFLTVNYIDRFLTSKIVSIGKLQLVGATAILVASKYEEINCPSLQDIVYMVDGGYSMEEILKAERFMLSMLSFELGWPGPMSFLRRVSKADDYDLETRTLAKYFLELTIMDERFVASPPSYLAAGAHCLSRLILNKGDWTKAHVHYSGYTWNQLKPLVTMMIECCEQPRLHHAAVFEKYAEKRFKEASTAVQLALDAGFTLPNHSMPVRNKQPQLGRIGDALDQLESLQETNGRLVSSSG